MNTGKFYGVGLGPGDPGLVTLKALKVLQCADIIFTSVSKNTGRSVSESIVDSLPEITAERRGLAFSMTTDMNERREMMWRNISEIAKALDKGKNCVFALIGDPLTYGTFGYILKALQEKIPELELETVPGVNSWSALSAAAGEVLCEDLESLRIVPSYLDLSDKEIDKILDSGDTVVFLKTYRSRDKILRKLREHNVNILYGSNIGMENQFICRNSNIVSERDNEYLSMIIVKPEKNKAIN